MKPHSNNSSSISQQSPPKADPPPAEAVSAKGGSASGGGSRQWRLFVILPTAFCLLLTTLSGCESVQRKFTRKSKGPRAVPTPVINFQDYTQAMTPLDRYRKHYLMFDYWNGEFMDGLRAKPLNAKRVKLAATESLNELTTLQSLVAEDLEEQFAPLIKSRAEINQEVQAGRVSEFSANRFWRELDAQSRTIRRDLFWRNVQDRLKPAQASAAAPSASETPPSAGTPSTP